MSGGKRDSLEETVQKAEIVLLDIEGTTTSISFVKDTLFPYIRENLESYVKTHWTDDEFAQDLVLLREQAAKDEAEKVEGLISIPEGTGEEVQKALVSNIVWQMDHDRKTKALKQLQGHVMRDGYSSGKLKGHVYEDVVPALRSWVHNNRQVYIYSSGSIEAQKLLFSHTEEGNLLELFSGHFDTEMGAKTETDSYSKIIKKIGCESEKTVFFTDVPTEAKAARSAGVNAVLVSRPGNAPLSEDDHVDFAVIKSFHDIVFETCTKRKRLSEDEPVPPKANENCEDVEMMEVSSPKVSEELSSMKVEKDNPVSAVTAAIETTKSQDSKTEMVDLPVGNEAVAPEVPVKEILTVKELKPEEADITKNESMEKTNHTVLSPVIEEPTEEESELVEKVPNSNEKVQEVNDISESKTDGVSGTPLKKGAVSEVKEEKLKTDTVVNDKSKANSSENDDNTSNRETESKPVILDEKSQLKPKAEENIKSEVASSDKEVTEGGSEGKQAETGTEVNESKEDSTKSVVVAKEVKSKADPVTKEAESKVDDVVMAEDSRTDTVVESKGDEVTKEVESKANGMEVKGSSMENEPCTEKPAIEVTNVKVDTETEAVSKVEEMKSKSDDPKSEVILEQKVSGNEQRTEPVEKSLEPELTTEPVAAEVELKVDKAEACTVSSTEKTEMNTDVNVEKCKTSKKEDISDQTQLQESKISSEMEKENSIETDVENAETEMAVESSIALKKGEETEKTESKREIDDKEVDTVSIPDAKKEAEVKTEEKNDTVLAEKVEPKVEGGLEKVKTKGDQQELSGVKESSKNEEVPEEKPKEVVLDQSASVSSAASDEKMEEVEVKPEEKADKEENVETNVDGANVSQLSKDTKEENEQVEEKMEISEEMKTDKKEIHKTDEKKTEQIENGIANGEAECISNGIVEEPSVKKVPAEEPMETAPEPPPVMAVES